jgi:hypothetical protein
MENQESPEKKWAKTMLKLDLEMQSGAIWTDEKTEILKDENYLDAEETQNVLPDRNKLYTILESMDSIILDGEPIKYGAKTFPNQNCILK